MSSTVELITPNVVKVGPGELDELDILEYAEALIEEHGHRVGDSGDEKQGWSIHGAVGEAAKRATGSSAKDSGTARPLREAAAAAVERTSGKTEFVANDEAKDKTEAVAILRAARGA